MFFDVSALLKSTRRHLRVWHGKRGIPLFQKKKTTIVNVCGGDEQSEQFFKCRTEQAKSSGNAQVLIFCTCCVSRQASAAKQKIFFMKFKAEIIQTENQTDCLCWVFTILSAAPAGD